MKRLRSPANIPSPSPPSSYFVPPSEDDLKFNGKEERLICYKEDGKEEDNKEEDNNEEEVIIISV